MEMAIQEEQMTEQKARGVRVRFRPLRADDCSSIDYLLIFPSDCQNSL